MRSKSKIGIEWKIAFSEIRLFLGNHLLEFHKIWRENTLGNKKQEYWEIWTLTKEILDIPVNLQQGIIENLC